MNLEVLVGHFIGNFGSFVVLCVGLCLNFNIHDEVTRREEKCISKVEMEAVKVLRNVQVSVLSMLFCGISGS